jgi:hypothetical protein
MNEVNSSNIAECGYNNHPKWRWIRIDNVRWPINFCRHYHSIVDHQCAMGCWRVTVVIQNNTLDYYDATCL